MLNDSFSCSVVFHTIHKTPRQCKLQEVYNFRYRSFIEKLVTRRDQLQNTGNIHSTFANTDLVAKHAYVETELKKIEDRQQQLVVDSYFEGNK